MNSFSSPAYSAIVPEVLEQEDIVTYNAISNGGSELINLAGPLLGIIALDTFGPRWAIILNGISFLLSAIAESFLRYTEKEVTTTKEESTIDQIRNGLVYLFSRKDVLLLVGLSAIVNFSLAGYNYLAPFFNFLSPKGYGSILVAQGIGSIFAAGITSFSRKYRISLKKMLLQLGCCGLALCFIPLAFQTEKAVLRFLPFAVFGFFLALYNIAFFSFVQDTVEDNYLGRVFSIIFTMAVLFMPLGTLISTVLLKTDSVEGFCYVGIFITVTSLLAFCIKWFFQRSTKKE